MTMTPVSFGSLALNNANYQAIIPVEAPASWRANLVENQRSGAFPQAASLQMDGITFPMRINIRGSGSLRELQKTFNNPEYYRGLELVKLIAQDDQGSQWSMMVVSLNLIDTGQKGATALLRAAYPIWERESVTPLTWNITASGQTKIISPGGNAPALPVYEITPKGANGGDYATAWPITVYNRMNVKAVRYPLQIVSGWDTATLVSGGNLRSDCADVRVVVDGQEIDHWLVRPNTANTAIWVNLNLSPKIELKLGTAIPATGAVGEIVFDKSAAAALKLLPAAGILRIGAEEFTYSGKNEKLLKVGGVQRAQRNTSMASHATGVSCIWIEHDIQVLYGFSGALAREVDERYRPAFELTGDNETWQYLTFGDVARLNAGGWVGSVIKSAGKLSFVYTAVHDATDADPVDVTGMAISPYLSRNRWAGDSADLEWRLYNPFGLTSIEASGEKLRRGTKWPTLKIQKSADGSRWLDLRIETSPVNADTWTAFTTTVLNTAPTASFVPRYVRVDLAGVIDSAETAAALAELNAVTVKPIATNIPMVIAGTVNANYQFDATLINETTGESLRLIYPMVVNKTLIVDSSLKRIDYLGQSAEPALQPYPRRGEWLPLRAGVDNTLRFEATATGAVEIVIKYRERKVW